MQRRGFLGLVAGGLAAVGLGQWAREPETSYGWIGVTCSKKLADLSQDELFAEIKSICADECNNPDSLGADVYATPEDFWNSLWPGLKEWAVAVKVEVAGNPRRVRSQFGRGSHPIYVLEGAYHLSTDIHEVRNRWQVPTRGARVIYG